MNKTANAALAALLGLAACAVVTAPAHAAAKRCVDGKWRLTSVTASSSVTTRDDGTVVETSKGRGGTGTLMTIAGTKATFNFAKSAKLTVTGTYVTDQGTVSLAAWALYRGSLTVKVKASGPKKGKLTGSPKTAKGNATAHLVQTKPDKADLGKYNVAADMRKGGTDLIVPLGDTYTCAGKTLKFTYKLQKSDEVNATKENAVLVYKRV